MSPSLPTSEKQARLFIDFEHPLKSGTLRLWLDGVLLLDLPLTGRAIQNIAGLKLRKGGMEKLFEVAPRKA